MKTIIVAAGDGTRIANEFKDVPKSLIPINGKTIFERQKDIFEKNNISEFIVITGPEYNSKDIGVKYIKDYENKNHDILGSLLLAKEYFKGDIIISYSDILFEEEIIKQLIAAKGDIVIAIDLNWKKEYENRTEHTVLEAENVLINDKGENIDQALPSMPIELLGINKVPKAGDDFVAVENEKEAKEIYEYRNENSKSEKNILQFATQESAFKNQTTKELNVIVKSDVHGSSEAIKNAILNINHEEIKAKIIHSDVGMITETDVTLAKASNALLIAFNIKPSKEAKKLAQDTGVKIDNFNIIYEVIDFIKAKMSGLLSPDVDEQIIGSAEVLEIFKVSKVGKVAGSKVLNGEINNESNARLIRDGSIVYNGKVSSIFREKNATKKVSAGLECGITLKDFSDYKKKDIIEVYKSVVTERRI